jgi:hypothetical protein
VFPYQFVLAAAFTVVLIASYLLIRRGSIPRSTGGPKAPGNF